MVNFTVQSYLQAKNKADKNRSRVEEVFLKTTHAARAEAAAARREEKRRQEKERILQVWWTLTNQKIQMHLYNLLKQL